MTVLSPTLSLAAAAMPVADTEAPLYVRHALEAVSGLLAVALVLVLWNRVLRRRMAGRTRELVRSLAALRHAKHVADQARDELAATLGAIPDLMFEIDLEGHYLSVHATRLEHLAAPPETLRGRTVTEVLPARAAQECMEAVREANLRGWASGRVIELEVDAGRMWFELSVARKSVQVGTLPSFIVLSRDVTARRMAEESARRMAQLYATLSHCNEAIVRCTDLKDLLDAICRIVVSNGGMQMAWIGRIEPDSPVLQPVAMYGAGIEYLEGLEISTSPDSPTGRGPTGIALREDRPYWCLDYLHDPVTAAWHERGRLYGWAASAALPLHSGGRVVGAISLYAREAGAFNAEAQELLLKMAMDIDFALERFRKDAERARMEEAILESETKYRELTETINDVIWKLDPETGRFLYVSPSVLRLRGYTPQEVMALPVTAAMTADSAALAGEVMAVKLAEFLAGELSTEDYVAVEVEQPCKDGSTVWTEVVASFVRNSRTGKPEVRGVTRDISDRKSAEARIQHLAHYDQLTGLPNRTLLKDRFNYALGLAQRHGGTVAVMFLDLDHFKNINDTLGHDVGDQLLIEIGRRLQALLRSGDTVARLGGDEFIFVLPDTDADGAACVATKLIEEVSRPCVVDRHELRTTPSIGIAMYPDDGSDVDTLSRNADVAMYQAKKDGRNEFRFFTEALQARSTRTLVLANALHHALDQGQLSLQYQPQMSLHEGRVVGAEALLRWQHPELGAIAPSEFIPIAEGNGLIIRIGEWVLRRVAEQARAWLDAGLPPLVVAVNLSAAQFRQHNLPELVAGIVDEIGLPASSVELELTEAVAMNDPQTAIAMMDRLYERGFGISIDDFGTGYSSLSYLKRFKVNRLKIDRSFVRDITEDPDDKAIVTAVIHLARSLGLHTIAEGVETQAQLDFLRAHGCHEVQGYFFSKPLSAVEFEHYVRSRALCAASG